MQLVIITSVTHPVFRRLLCLANFKYLFEHFVFCERRTGGCYPELLLICKCFPYDNFVAPTARWDSVLTSAAVKIFMTNVKLTSVTSGEITTIGLISVTFTTSPRWVFACLQCVPVYHRFLLPNLSYTLFAVADLKILVCTCWIMLMSCHFVAKHCHRESLIPSAIVSWDSSKRF